MSRSTRSNEFLTSLSPARLVGWGRPPDPPADDRQVEANIRHLVLEISWYGILLGTTINFMQVYVVRLGATSLLLSAVTYGPALVALLWQLPGTRLITRSGHRMRWVLGTGILHRSGYLLVALVPFLLESHVAEVVVGLLVLQALATTLSATSFVSMLSDSAPPDRISQLVSSRMAGMGITSTLSTLACRWVLQRLTFPLSFQLMFIIGFTASAIGMWHLSQVRVADPPAERVERGHWRHEFHRALRHPGFFRYLAAACVLQMCVGMVTPLIPLYWVRRLNATDPEISLIVTAASAATVAGAILLRRLTKRIGRLRAVTLAAGGYVLYPLLTVFSTSVWLAAAWSMLGGLFNAMLIITMMDNLVSATPAEDRTNFIAVYNIIIYFSLVIGPLAAGFLARGNDGQTGLFVAAGVGVIASILFASRLRRPTDLASPA